MTGLTRKFILPTGQPVAYLNKEEVQILQAELWAHRSYLKHGITLEKGAVVIDAGANIGLFALWVNDRCKGVCHVYSFEPVPEVFEILKLNLTPHVNLCAYQNGLSDKDEESLIRFHPQMTLWSTRDGEMDDNRVSELHATSANVAAVVKEDIRRNKDRVDPAFRFMTRLMPASMFAWMFRGKISKYGQKTSVRCSFRRLGGFLEEQKIGTVDLLKVDTEGDELKVLQGIDEMQWPHIRQVVAEADGVGRGRATEIAEFLRARGFKVIEEAQEICGVQYEALGCRTHQPVAIFAHRER